MRAIKAQRTRQNRSRGAMQSVTLLHLCARTVSAAASIAVLFAVATAAHAQLADDNVFVRAVVEGAASAPLSNGPESQSARQAVKRRTGSDAPLYIEARRIVRFAQQPSCGRVVFAISQPATHTAWQDMGGQLNICSDGEPPMRACRGAPGKLVPAEAACADGTRPVDTAEVSAAIQDAIRGGSLAPETLHAQTQALRPGSSAAVVPGSGGNK